MSWATQYIDQLKKGETVQFRPRGNSMSGKIESGQLCTVEPANLNSLEVGDIVLCKVNGYQYLHLIKARQGERFQIGNNRGRINGWIGENGIYGKCIRVE
ncbi:MAG TPA: S24 family peptidase [Verrucomicrobiae bacterium]|nr:S24 family peptidase [Verrucomicrobiae bacterium]